MNEQPQLCRDCAPHRGRLLCTMAMVSAFAGVLSCLLAPILIASLIAVFVLWLSAVDLKTMDEGLMDPDGYDLTVRAKEIALLALAAVLFFGGSATVLAVWVASMYYFGAGC